MPLIIVVRWGSGAYWIIHRQSIQLLSMKRSNANQSIAWYHCNQYNRLPLFISLNDCHEGHKSSKGYYYRCPQSWLVGQSTETRSFIYTNFRNLWDAKCENPMRPLRRSIVDDLRSVCRPSIFFIKRIYYSNCGRNPSDGSQMVTSSSSRRRKQWADFCFAEKSYYTTSSSKCCRS